MKKILSTFLLCMCAITAIAKQNTPLTLYAHRGCWSKSATGEFIVPENSVPAVAMAKKMGYTGIELDVHYTKDRQMVILHDGTINRTMRRASDYSRIEEPVRLADLTFEELRRDYVLESTNPEWRTPIPTLEELLTECKKQGIVPMLHSNLVPSYRVAQQMFGNEWVAFTSEYEPLKEVRTFSDCIILYSINKGTPDEIAPRLEQLGARLEEGVRRVLRDEQLPLTFIRDGSMFCLHFTTQPVYDLDTAMSGNFDMFRRYFHAMLEQGAYVAPSPYETGFISTAHTEADIDATVEAMQRALHVAKD